MALCVRVVPLVPVALCLSLALTGCGGGGGGDDTPVTPVSDSLDLSPVSVTAPESGLPDGWATGGVFIEIYVRAYQDSDGDGIGDLAGLTQRLDYLQDLGVDGIWLMPIFSSQDHDHGYAVSDYRNIESSYGTTAEFQAFLTAAHAHGIGVIVDYVMNHSALQNPLFTDANNNVGGKRDWYVWSSSNPGWTNWNGDASWHAGKSGYYYGVFWDQMPDFNLENDTVIDFHHNNLRYWLNMGLDGYRFDAVAQLVENGANAYVAQPENAAILYDVQQIVMDDYDNRYMVCEDADEPLATVASDSCGSAFAFGFNDGVRGTVNSGSVNATLLNVLENFPLSDMGVMLGNHDSFAGERLYDDFDGDLSDYKLAAATQLTMPGQPFLYYGDEIGMNASNGNSGDAALRGPMSWTSNGGFSSATPFRAYSSNRSTYNVASETADADSLLNHYKALIAARHSHDALRYGDLTVLQHNSVLAFRRESDGEGVLVVLNYSASARSLNVDVGVADAPLTPIGSFGSAMTTDSSGSVTATVPAKGIWLLSYSLD